MGGASAAYRSGGVSGLAKAAGAAAASPLKRAAEDLKARFNAGAASAGGQGASSVASSGASSGAESSAASTSSHAGAPGWARRLHREQSLHRTAAVADQTLRSGDGGRGGASVDVSEGE
jgi:type IV secretion system protein TrbL